MEENSKQLECAICEREYTKEQSQSDRPNICKICYKNESKTHSQRLKNGTVVYRWSGTYERIIKDEVLEYSSQIDMYWLKESQDWFVRGSLYTNLRALKKSL